MSVSGVRLSVSAVRVSASEVRVSVSVVRVRVSKNGCEWSKSEQGVTLFKCCLN